MRQLVILAGVILGFGAGASEHGRYFVVAGVYENMESAMKLERRLEEVFTGVHTESRLASGTLYNRVVLGPVSNEGIESLKLHLAAQGVPDAWVLPASEVEIMMGRHEAAFIEPSIESSSEPSGTAAAPRRPATAPGEKAVEASSKPGGGITIPTPSPVVSYRSEDGTRVDADRAMQAMQTEPALQKTENTGERTETRKQRREHYNPARLVLPKRDDE